ncbi:MAG: peptide-methionine (R)-S-oxide reductase MsrB [Ignavibacterium sp.]|jgi:peptide-methionine (R)-S-oxide reductase|nr:peptide-methionine (R)-S-oxide reductase MsrB [Ignavibacterium sp.]
MNKIIYVFIVIVAGVILWLLLEPTYPEHKRIFNNHSESDTLNPKEKNMEQKIIKTEEEWKKELTPEEYNILREKGTERPFTGKYWDHFEIGIYICAACGAELFASDTKFESSCGWPSYFQPIDSSRIIYKEDRSFGMIRTEVMCARCGGHLGHVFDDGPPPTGLRYCINSGSMKFISKKK